MNPCERSFALRWQSALIELRTALERVQFTADELPMYVALVNDRDSHPCPLGLLRSHMNAFSDYTTALSCVQALLAEHGDGASGVAWPDRPWHQAVAGGAARDDSVQAGGGNHLGTAHASPGEDGGDTAPGPGPVQAP